MIVLVSGTPDSGKSAIAENIACDLQNGKLVYLATMIAYDGDGFERINKHRQMREGKGFITIEQPIRITKIVDSLEEESTVLLECITNLVGNEMYENSSRYIHEGDDSVLGINIEDLCDKLIEDICEVGKKVANLIIVTNRFEENDIYQGETRKYTDAVNALNQRLEKMVDEVIKVGV